MPKVQNMPLLLIKKRHKTPIVQYIPLLLILRFSISYLPENTFSHLDFENFHKNCWWSFERDLKLKKPGGNWNDISKYSTLNLLKNSSKMPKFKNMPLFLVKKTPYNAKRPIYDTFADFEISISYLPENTLSHLGFENFH